jgi:hypothetical protein
MAPEAEIDEWSIAFDDGEYFDLSSFAVRTGQHLTINLRSDEFDTVMMLAMFGDGEFIELVWEDDSGEGTNPRIEFTVPETGEFVILGEPYHRRERGCYTLRVGAN